MTRIAGDADDGGDVDDAAETAAHHRMCQLARQAEHRRQVHFDDVIPVLVAHAHEEAVLGDAGIVDEDIHALQLGFGLFAERLYLGSVGKVSRENLDAVAKFRRQRFKLFNAGAVQADGCALAVEKAGDFFADAAGRAGYESLAACQI
ncbi:hypothetical protein D3C78_1389090 [compost metagenome]